MGAKNRVIIDTDPGVDDIVALLLALSASPEDLEVVMISVTYGNVPLQSCLRNVVALFHVLEKELAWRKDLGKPGFGSLGIYRPVVAVGAEHPLEEDHLAADFFHGSDGLHNVHEAHPHLSPSDTWRSLFRDEEIGDTKHTDPPSYSALFKPSKVPAHREILRLLKEEADSSITIVAVGPLTNLALAAAEDPETFLRAKEVVVMGGAVHVPGNITPQAEFNCYADSIAAARVFALTSTDPASTMPPIRQGVPCLGPYPTRLSRRLKLTLFPLDLTSPHEIFRPFWSDKIQPLTASGSPLAQWVDTFVSRTLDKIQTMVPAGVDAGWSLHDPLTIWFVLTQDHAAWKSVPKLEDIRIETAGQWTKGMHLVDRRNRAKSGEEQGTGVSTYPADPMDAVTLNEVPGDRLGWLLFGKGNSIRRMVASPGEKLFPEVLFKRIFG